MASDGAKVRGSAKLRANQVGKHVFSEVELNRFAEVLQADEIELVDWFPYGIPAPDTVFGTIRVRPTAVAKALQQLFEQDVVRLRAVDIFPYGIPVINELMVKVEAVPALRG